jgi:hypothetical protein
VVVFGGEDLRRPPFDLGNTQLRAALGDDGRALLSWIATRAPRHGDRPLAATVSEGSLESGFARPRRLGSRCRAANAAVPLIGASGPLVAWTDNVTRSVVRPPEEELPVAAGRLHVSAPDVPGESGVAAPGVRVRVPAGQRLRAGDPLVVRARCDGPCDLRVSARRGRRGPVTAVGSARLGDAREHTLRLRRGFGGRIVRPGGGPMSVTARACAPGGTRSRTATARARVAARPVAPPPEPIGARAVRRGREIAVRWETRRPAHGHFEVAGLKRPGGRTDPRTSNFLNGAGRLRFRATLRLRPGDQVDWVRVTAYAARPPYPRRSVTVPVRTGPG